MLIRIGAAVSLAAMLSACGGISSPSQNTVDTFTGTVTPGNADTHLFNVSKNGEVFVTITALAPDNIVVGVLIGQQTSGGCAPLLGYTNNFAQRGAQALGGGIDKGSYCVAVFDSGGVTQATTYSLRVSHP
jgi:hypothetical protein